MPPIAALKPPGSVWIEVPRADGKRYGLLCGRDTRGVIWLRRVDVRADGALSCPRAALRRLPGAAPARPTEALWTEWALLNLVSETLDPTLGVAEVSEALDISAARDFLVAALLLEGGRAA